MTSMGQASLHTCQSTTLVLLKNNMCYTRFILLKITFKIFSSCYMYDTIYKKVMLSYHNITKTFWNSLKQCYKAEKRQLSEDLSTFCNRCTCKPILFYNCPDSDLYHRHNSLSDSYITSSLINSIKNYVLLCTATHYVIVEALYRNPFL